jgi:4-amino-4-deoxy-L-arabinose transferase-like glycosyltransferase
LQAWQARPGVTGIAGREMHLAASEQGDLARQWRPEGLQSEPGGQSRGRAPGVARAPGWILPWLLLIAALAWGLGSYPLLDPDEGRNSEVAREMAASGDFALPRLDGLPYLDKPVAFFAAGALSQRLFGSNEAAARLPSLLFALATAALTAWFAGRMFWRPERQGHRGRRGDGVRWVAALAALAAPLPIAFARTVIFDSMLAFFIVLALCAFWLAVEARVQMRAAAGVRQAAPIPAGAETRTPAAIPSGAETQPPPAAIPDRAETQPPPAATPGRAATEPPPAAFPDGAAAAGRAEPSYLPWTVLAWAAMGAGILTKGPVALAVPLLAAAPYAVYRRASRAVWHPLGIAAMALLVGPWLWWVSRQVPEFLHYALFTETWERIATPAMNREGPLWLYIPCLLAGTLPWSLLVIAGWRRSLRLRDAAGRIDPARLYLMLWIAVPFVMFSLSHSKRAQYILPLLPAVALLAAKVWADAENPHSTNDPIRTHDRIRGNHPSQPNLANDSFAAPHGLPGRRSAAAAWLILGILCAVAAPLVARSQSRALTHATQLPATLLALAAAFLVGAALLVLAGRRPRDHAAFAAYPGRFDAGAEPATFARGARGHALLVVGLVLPIAALPAISLPLLGEIGSHRSSRAAAAAIAPFLPPGAQVAGIHAFPPSLPFYLRRTMLVASSHGRELTSNYVIAYFQKWLAASPSETPLRAPNWWRSALATCEQPLIFVTWTDDAATRSTLAALGLPLIVTNDRMAAYGPCRPPTAPARHP